MHSKYEVHDMEKMEKGCFKLPLLSTLKGGEVAVAVKVVLRGDEDEALRLVSALRGKGARIESALFNSRDGQCSLTMILKFRDESLVHSVIEELKRQEKVVGLDYEVFRESVAVNRFLHPLCIDTEERVLVVRAEVLRSFIDGLRRRMGENAANVFLFHLGFSAGVAIASYAKSLFKRKTRTALARLLEEVLGYHQACGFGRFEVVEFNPNAPHVVIRVYGLVECAGRRSSRPTSTLYRGILAGMIGELCGVSVDVVETSCISMGSPFCEFRVSRL